jgi:hypothetical protein
MPPFYPKELPCLYLAQFHVAFPKLSLVVLTNRLDAHQKAAISAYADALIIKGDMPERVALFLRLAAAKVRLT